MWTNLDRRYGVIDLRFSRRSFLSQVWTYLDRRDSVDLRFSRRVSQVWTYVRSVDLRFRTYVRVQRIQRNLFLSQVWTYVRSVDLRFSQNLDRRRISQVWRNLDRSTLRLWIKATDGLPLNPQPCDVGRPRSAWQPTSTKRGSSCWEGTSPN